MASSSSEVSPIAEEARNWLELPRDVTASILSRLGAIEILTSGQMVCKSWLEICKDPLMWRTIDMRKLDDPDDRFNLERMCREAVDRSSGQLVDINVEYFGTDDLLQHITDRSSQIKRLRLFCCRVISDEGLIEAVEKLPLLEELDLTHCEFSSEPLEALGRSCPHLKSMKLNHQAYRLSHIDPFDDDDDEVDFNDEAIVIGENLPELRHLQLIGNSMTNIGLEAILDRCSKLESLDLRRCININLDGDLMKRCAEQIKHLRLPYDSLKDCGFVADPYSDILDEDNASADFSFDEYLQLEDEISDHFDYSSGNDYFDYDDFTNPFNYDDSDFW